MRKFSINTEALDKKICSYIRNSDVKTLKPLRSEKSELKLVESSGNIPDGEVKEYRTSGKLASIYTYKNNKLNGNVKIYYPSGPLLSEGIYVDDELQEFKQ